MDYNLYQYRGSGSDSYYSCFPMVSSVPTNLSGSLKFESRNSPTSPFSALSDTETLTAYADGLEPTDSISESTLSSSLSVDYKCYLQPTRLSPLCLQDTLLTSPWDCLTFQNANHNQQIKHALLELESSLMAADEDVKVIIQEPALGGNVSSQTLGKRSRSWDEDSRRSHLRHSESFRSSRDDCRFENLPKTNDDFARQTVPPDYLKQLLILCAKALSKNKLLEFEKLAEKVRAAVSISGDPIQRVGAYMLEGLIARKESSGTNIYRSLNYNEPESRDILTNMHILYEICPYLKFGYMAANGAIAEACKSETRIHIIDFQLAQGTQWMTLLQALAARPSGAPHVRIAAIDDPRSKYAQGGRLAAVSRRLASISQKFNIPVEFHAVPVSALDITKDLLDVRPGEALVVNFPLHLHHTPDESVDVCNPRDGLLRMVKSLSPKVVTLVEQESNTNTAPFLPRFAEALDYYSAMFESIDASIPRGRKERIIIEEHCLAGDMVNIVACEGKDRVERHELLGKWRSRLKMAGFKPYPLSSYVNSVICHLLQDYSEHYTSVEKDGAMLLGWKDRNLISASAWH